MAGHDQNLRAQFTQLTSYWAETCPHLQAYVHSMVSNYEDAEDIVQQVAVVAAERFDTYDPERPFKHWAMGIARIITLEYYKRSKNKQVVFVDGATIDKYTKYFAEEFDTSSDMLPKLRNCMARLTQRSRHLLELRYVRALRPGEIAERLDTTANTIRVALFRIRTALRDCISTTSVPVETDET